MPPKISPVAFLQRARKKGSERNREGIDGTKVQGGVLPDTEKNITRLPIVHIGHLQRSGSDYNRGVFEVVMRAISLYYLY